MCPTGSRIDLSRLGAGERLSARASSSVDVPVAAGATLDDALGGGEDYELLATLPAATAVEAARERAEGGFGVPLTEIGAIVEGEGLTAVEPGRRRATARADGWDHFR